MTTDTRTAQPNTALQAARLSLGWTHVQLAGRIGVSARHVKRLLDGHTTSVHPQTAAALEAATGLPVAMLGLSAEPQSRATTRPAGDPPQPSGRTAPARNFAGVWVSTYTYESSSRGQTFTDSRYVVIVHRGARLSVSTLTGSGDSSMAMDLTVRDNVVGGTWVEHTNPDGYYTGAEYYGVVQLLADPTGRRMAGQWAGFGRDGVVNTGPWSLTFQTAAMDKTTLADYGRPVDSE